MTRNEEYQALLQELETTPAALDDAERIKEFEALKVPVDTYAVGSSLFDGNINFTADIVMVDGKECAKAGRVHLPNPRLELVK